ncbi:uncharacterized protein LOC111379008 [Olea europaea var. sylvestris]|uniref:uncharacterized protein LOC111379008 n=1 Tax=Olea europaea var. sylvestris TaxID=158386 RepID=UPI000C1D2390|nr:uncharacterized protein LOC111379008 [Olea europaea var. sylvestris]
MEQLEGFTALGQERKVCRLVKSLYGLKQAPKFDMKDMGLVDVILRIKITRTPNGLVLSQSHYIDKILDKFNKSDTTVARTPMDLSLHLSKNTSDGVSQLEYSG